uniref:Uncharacterized protein n=1 Tax=Opuntia streptacantha TaxID=393608 RepID=A0A7C9AEV9_OPUST
MQNTRLLLPPFSLLPIPTPSTFSFNSLICESNLTLTTSVSVVSLTGASPAAFSLLCFLLTKNTHSKEVKNRAPNETPRTISPLLCLILCQAGERMDSEVDEIDGLDRFNDG